MNSAPFYADLALGPQAGQAYWLTAADGVQLRIAVWPEGTRGTVLLFPGRTEYAEKYGRAASDFGSRGYAQVAVDWRGQGLADRQLSDRNVGHVESFADFQKDVAAVLRAAEALALPRPFYLVSHSMGGAIALRALIEGLPIKAAVFSAPMWGILLSPLARSFTWTLSQLVRFSSLAHRYAPSTGPATYLVSAPFDDNVLTTDEAMWSYMKAQVTGVPELALGGPSLNWLHQALSECRRLGALASPRVPALTVIGSNERVVDAARVRERMARWPGGRLEVAAGAEHEIMMEHPETRRRFFDAAADLFDAHR